MSLCECDRAFSGQRIGIWRLIAEFQEVVEQVSKSWFKAQNDCIASNGGISSSFLSS